MRPHDNNNLFGDFSSEVIVIERFYIDVNVNVIAGIMTSHLQVNGKRQKLTSQVCLPTSDLHQHV